MGALVGADGIGRNGIVGKGDRLQVRLDGRAGEQVEGGGRRHAHRGAERGLPLRHVVLRDEDVELRERTPHRDAVVGRRGGHVHRGEERVQGGVVGLQSALEREAGHVAGAELHVIGTAVHGEEHHLVLLPLGKGQGDVAALGVHRLHGLEALSANLGSGDQGTVALGEGGGVEPELAGGVVKDRRLRGRLGQGIPQIEGEGHLNRLTAQGGVGIHQLLLDAGGHREGCKGSQQGEEDFFHLSVVCCYSARISKVTVWVLPLCRRMSTSTVWLPAVRVTVPDEAAVPSKRHARLL